MSAVEDLEKLKRKKEKLDKQIRETEVKATEEKIFNSRALSLGKSILDLCDVDDDMFLEYIKEHIDDISELQREGGE